MNKKCEECIHNTGLCMPCSRPCQYSIFADKRQEYYHNLAQERYAQQRKALFNAEAQAMLTALNMLH